MTAKQITKRIHALNWQVRELHEDGAVLYQAFFRGYVSPWFSSLAEVLTWVESLNEPAEARRI